MKYPRKALYEEINRFYLITGEDEGESEPRIRGLIGGLVRKARKAIDPNWETKQKIHALLQLMYGEWGFHCDSNQYYELENFYLEQVLSQRKGMPVTLGAILLYLAESLDLPIYPVNFPSQLILRADVDGETAFIDPWNGKYISQEQLQKLYEGALGFGAELSAESLAIADVEDLNIRFQQLAKHSLLQAYRNYEAYNYISALLSMRPDDPYEIRDRAIVLTQMGCINAAIEDFELFLEKCPDDPTALLLLPQLENLKSESEPVH
ncbi:SirB1 family protein [Caviibacterium pharyngocola]|uniref:Protein SirB1 N-terminal domain-containing protein n=1 Tax=Caviibacterium pharyngocola TaxID=28159 RepID=A0A2M8RWU9_9PAST|nr:SirB1 family protein [Caviibacterium pharyngocola]PJG83376.1 hypothetical protein CVP04_04435 [Caviibacterium pharyngocola]